MRHYLVFLFSLIFSSTLLKAQVGGAHTFSFLSLPNSARTTALGGSCMSITDWDGSCSLQNPALLNKEQSNMLSVNMMNYFKDIGFGNISYVYHRDSIGTFSAGLQYVRYGNFKQTDVEGNTLGNFTAAEYAYVLGYSRSFKKGIAGGINFKYISSNLAGNMATGLAFDLGLRYRSNDSLFHAGIVVRNAGMMLNRYSSNIKETLPLDIQAGVAFKFKHAPFRIYVTGTNLQNPNTAFINTSKPKTINYATGEVIEEKLKFSQKVLTHITFGTEFLLGKWVQLRFGYNPRTRREMVIDATNGRPGLTGFSWGFGIRLPYVSFSYGSGLTFIGQGTNMFSVALDINRFKSKKLGRK